MPTAVDLNSMTFFAGVDPCKTRLGEVGHDRFVMAIGAYNGEKIFLVRFIEGRFGIEEQVAIILQASKQFNLGLINIEEDMAVSELLKRYPEINVNSSQSLLSKDVRLQSLGSAALRGQILFPGQLGDSGMLEPVDELEEFLNEWRHYPGSKHDDFLDALDKLREAINLGVEPASVIFRRSSVTERELGKRHQSRLLFHREIRVI